LQVSQQALHTPLQLKGALSGHRQLPSSQMAPIGHRLLQRPQCSTSVFPSTQVFPHFIIMGSAQVQAPFEQISLWGWQAWPQDPQLLSSVWRLKHMFPQRVVPVWQQMPPMQLPLSQSPSRFTQVPVPA
jgi:hypothetical protein